MKGEQTNSKMSQQEEKDMQLGAELMRSAQGGSAEAAIEAYLAQYGLIRDRTIDDDAKAEAERHRRYVLSDNIRAFLKNYRAQQEILIMAKEELQGRVATESIGTLGDKEEAGEERFFDTLCRKLDLLSAYDERAMRRRYESRIIACRYIEEAITTLKRGLRILKAHHPDSYEILNIVYIEGPVQPTLKEVIEKLELAGPSSYYQKLERAEKQLASLVLNCTFDQNIFLKMLVFLKQQEVDGDFPL